MFYSKVELRTSIFLNQERATLRAMIWPDRRWIEQHVHAFAFHLFLELPELVIRSGAERNAIHYHFFLTFLAKMHESQNLDVVSSSNL